MAKTPKELDSEAKEKRMMRTRPETLDKDVSRSGAAVSTPSQPRFDSDVSMSGAADRKGDVTGEAVSEESSKFSEEDVEMVIEKTGKSKEDVVEALEESDGDIAEAILNLKD